MSNTVSIIDKETIAAVRSKADIVKIVEETVSLKKSGTSWKGLCPFHNESTPSMHVTAEKNLWHCFGCGEGGDVIDYIRKRDALNFAEAVEILADKSNITVHYTSSYVNQHDVMSGKKLSKINTIAENFFHTQWLDLPPSHLARKFLAEKTLNEKDLIETFKIGWAPHPSETGRWNELSELLLKEGFTKKDIIESGLANENAQGEMFDKFRGRVIWPVRNPAGFVVGFGGRRVFTGEKEGPKYLNSPETVLYKKSDILYNLETARKYAHEKKQIVIVEGYTDVMALAKIGIPNSVAACGTAFGSTHFATLKRILGDSLRKTAGLGSGTVSIVFMFDGDDAGKKAALRVAESAQHLSAETYAVILPSGLDPSDMVKNGSGDELKNLLQGATTTLTQFAISVKMHNHNIHTPEGVALAVDEVAEIISKIPNPITKEQYIQKVASELNISENLVLNAVKQAENDYQWSNVDEVGGGHKHGSETFGGEQSSFSLQNPLNNSQGNPNFYNEEETILVALQNPQAAAVFVHMLNSESFTSPLLGIAYQVIAHAYSNVITTAVNFSKMNGVEFRDNVFNALNDISTRERFTLTEVTLMKETINRLMVQQPKTLMNTSEDFAHHTESVMKKAVRNSLEKELLQLKMQQLNHAPDSAEYAALWSEMMKVQSEVKKLNSS